MVLDLSDELLFFSKWKSVLAAWGPLLLVWTPDGEIRLMGSENHGGRLSPYCPVSAVLHLVSYLGLLMEKEAHEENVALKAFKVLMLTRLLLLTAEHPLFTYTFSMFPAPTLGVSTLNRFHFYHQEFHFFSFSWNCARLIHRCTL